MKTTTPNPVFAKIRLYLRILASCVIVTCLFLIIIHPEAWITPACIIVATIMQAGVIHASGWIIIRNRQVTITQDARILR